MESPLHATPRDDGSATIIVGVFSILVKKKITIKPLQSLDF